jgi:D-amino-acid dehydrogenase
MLYKEDNIIVGSGVIGLMCAYYLHKQGKSVCIIDEGELNSGSSYGNGGLLSPFEKGPLAQPGVVLSTLRQMMNKKSPFSINFTSDLSVYKWLVKFFLSSKKTNVKRTTALFEKFGEVAMCGYKAMSENDKIDFGFHRDGALLVYSQQQSLDEALIKFKNHSQYVDFLNYDGVKKYIPCVNDSVLGGVFTKRNGRIDPRLVLKSMYDYLKKNGVKFVFNEKIIDCEFASDKLDILYSKENEYKANNFIMATGHKDMLAKKAHKEIVMTPAKGYSITFRTDKKNMPKVGSLFVDSFMVVTPFENDIRITSKFELAPKNKKIDMNQINSLKNIFLSYVDNMNMNKCENWSGYRPLAYSDIPTLGRDDKYNNLIYATGLGWLGVTFAPAVGQIISDLIVNNKQNYQSDDILLFSSIYQD